MNSHTQGQGGTPRIGWPAGTVGGFLLASAGLELLAHQMFGETDVDTLLWALYVGFWTYVLGLVGVLALSVRWLVDWRRDRADRKALSRLSPAEASLRYPSQAHRQGLVLGSDEGHEADSRTRVAGGAMM